MFKNKMFNSIAKELNVIEKYLWENYDICDENHDILCNVTNYIAGIQTSLDLSEEYSENYEDNKCDVDKAYAEHHWQQARWTILDLKNYIKNHLNLNIKINY